jgi:hypothetical protein
MLQTTESLLTVIPLQFTLLLPPLAGDRFSPAGRGTAKPKGRKQHGWFDYAAFFLLDADSLIARIVTAAIMAYTGW